MQVGQANPTPGMAGSEFSTGNSKTIVTTKTVPCSRTSYPVSITVSTNVVISDISIGSSPFSTAGKVPEIFMNRSLLVTKLMNLETSGNERQMISIGIQPCAGSSGEGMGTGGGK